MNQFYRPKYSANLLENGADILAKPCKQQLIFAKSADLLGGGGD